jgi:hypothetical protein
MSEFTILVAPTRQADGSWGDSVDTVRVQWEPAPPTIPAEAAEYLEQRWEIYVTEAHANQRTLFNGPITRLIDAHRSATGEIQLVLGPADYKTFLVAHLRDRPWFRVHAPGVSAAALGNSVLLTRGDRALLGIRSPRVSAYADHAHLIGGVLDLLTEAERQVPSAEHLVAHLLKELGEEASVTASDLMPRNGTAGRGRWPRFYGVARDEFLAQPEAIWQWEVCTPLAEIAARLAPQEHGGAVEVTRERPPRELWERMTPVARHTWQVWAGAFGAGDEHPYLSQ